METPRGMEEGDMKNRAKFRQSTVSFPEPREFLGRNGAFKAVGLEVTCYPGMGTELRPVTTKGKPGRCAIMLPPDRGTLESVAGVILGGDKAKALTKRQAATVLAALRVFQRELPDLDPDIKRHFADTRPLSDKEIDALCEDIKFRA